MLGFPFISNLFFFYKKNIQKQNKNIITLLHFIIILYNILMFIWTADGYNRSEAIVVLFLQRAEDAKRCYATLLHAKTTIYGDRFSFDRMYSESLKNFLHEVYSEAEINPGSVAYLEADGSASKVSSIFQVDRMS